MIYLYNSLSKKKEKLEPINSGKVGMYVCGPTVYDAPHIGNARSNVIYDVLYRILIHHYGAVNVTYVRNITDVDDKINMGAKNRNITINELTAEVIKIFHDNMEKLNCLPPTIEPKATEHIAEMIEIIGKLIAKNHAYVADDHVYFDVSSDPHYGKLASRELDEMIAGARIAVNENKKNAGDFVLWKPKNPGDDPSSVFNSPWGEGRPGWHIECSAMSHKYLGVDFDIHGGGADLMFPHHTNEIAQSVCAFEHSHFAKLWVHNGFLTVNKEKMSKSLGNFITVNDLLKKGIDGEVIRYLLLSTHYKKPLDFNEELLNSAKKSIISFRKIIDEFEVIAEIAAEAEIIDALNNDLNTPLVLSMLHQYCSAFNKETSHQERLKIATMLKAGAKMIGLLDARVEKAQLDEELLQLIKEREDARREKDWAKTDQIRDLLKSKGVLLKDNKDGSTSWESYVGGGK